MERQAASQPGTSSRIFSHPRGLLVLAGTELWDRISFSGMQAILVLYMVERLLTPGHVERIVGFQSFRATVEAVTGPLAPQALASQIFGLYVGLIYFTPMFGGFIGDRITGRRAGVVAGALLMTAGHFCMAFEDSFLLALLLLIVGAGLLRGNLTPQVADLYAPGDQRRAVAFQLYSSMVALGAFVAPLITGLLSQVYGWDIAFGFAGFGMLIGLLIYVGGAAWLPSDHVRAAAAEKREPLGPQERGVVLTLLLLVPVGTLFWIAQAQIWNTYNLWVRDHVDLQVGAWTVPVPWLQALDGLAPLLTLPLLLAWWRWRARIGRPDDELGRMVAGCLIFGASVLILAAGQMIVGPDQRIPLLVPVLFHFVSNVGWLFFAPSANSLFAGIAPRSVRGTMIGVYTLSMFFGSVISGRLGGLYEQVAPELFWMLHAGLAALGGLILWAMSGWLRRIFATTADPRIFQAEALQGPHGAAIDAV